MTAVAAVVAVVVVVLLLLCGCVDAYVMSIYSSGEEPMSGVTKQESPQAPVCAQVETSSSSSLNIKPNPIYPRSFFFLEFVA